MKVEAETKSVVERSDQEPLVYEMIQKLKDDCTADIVS